MLGEVKRNRARPHGLQHRRVELHALADDAFEQHLAGTYLLGRDHEARVVRELSDNALVRQLHAIALDPRERDLQRRTLLNGVDSHRGLRTLGWGNHRLRREIEWNA